MVTLTVNERGSTRIFNSGLVMKMSRVIGKCFVHPLSFMYAVNYLWDQTHCLFMVMLSHSRGPKDCRKRDTKTKSKFYSDIKPFCKSNMFKHNFYVIYQSKKNDLASQN